MGALHEVLGPCEIDVCSPAKPVHVQARRWFTQQQDGLKQVLAIPENGWIFLNPLECRSNRRAKAHPVVDGQA